ncbi:uncharacterized protein LOC114840866 [Esox lucius]|uniref:uncharacterized protein LOC114840866 n=1 Tax=Esox lucius TaxID=8010 RepID=UPI001477475E|nr:uncharacterized protein LOC114840866 [Esox lucius]XP_028981044.2 uncharacterized protein LOC114840866 [Esox lucius]XP_028981045.2 uncharacterized protein LOC114840866 [Esox lucius]
MGRECLPFIFLMLLPVALVWANPPTLNTTSDLINIEFGHRFPRHGLHLLYFIAHELVVDDDDVIIPNFVPGRGDWGFFSYSDSKRVFPPLLDQNQQGYYSVGNLNLQISYSLPHFVTQSYRLALGSAERNRDRVVVRTSPNREYLEAVYITQCYPLNDPRSNQYDPQNTWQISPALLREIRNLSANRKDSLSVFLYTASYDVSSINFNNYCYYTGPDINIDQVEETSGQQPPIDYPAVNKRVTLSNSYNHVECFEILLEVKATDNGYARIRWSNIPDRLLDKGVQVNVCKDGSCLTLPIDMRSYGTYDSGESLNKGLSPRLQFIQTKSEMMCGPTYDDTDRKLPVDIKGFDASLQLYTKDGYACARLIIKNTFIDWKNKFGNSWVGFYSDHNKYNYNYDTHQWVTKFQPEREAEEHDMYVSCSNMAIRPEAQARFFLHKEYVSIAMTIPWER